jgi:hypothetical protein
VVVVRTTAAVADGDALQTDDAVAPSPVSFICTMPFFLVAKLGTSILNEGEFVFLFDSLSLPVLTSLLGLFAAAPPHPRPRQEALLPPVLFLLVIVANDESSSTTLWGKAAAVLVVGTIFAPTPIEEPLDLGVFPASSCSAMEECWCLASKYPSAEAPSICIGGDDDNAFHEAVFRKIPFLEELPPVAILTPPVAGSCPRTPEEEEEDVEADVAAALLRTTLMLAAVASSPEGAETDRNNPFGFNRS